jgi:hypothetical protein
VASKSPISINSGPSENMLGIWNKKSDKSLRDDDSSAEDSFFARDSFAFKSRSSKPEDLQNTIKIELFGQTQIPDDGSICGAVIIHVPEHLEEGSFNLRLKAKQKMLVEKITEGMHLHELFASFRAEKSKND